MKVITARQQIRGLPVELERAWHRPDGRWAQILQREPDTQKIHAAVLALDLETASIDDVYKAMGFASSWVSHPTCDECGCEVQLTVQIGEEPDYESHTASVCIECLQKALELAKREQP